MTNEQIKSELIKLAAEMVRCRCMPSEFIDDWQIPKSTPITTRRMIVRTTMAARDQSVEWGAKLARLVRLMK